MRYPPNPAEGSFHAIPGLSPDVWDVCCWDVCEIATARNRRRTVAWIFTQGFRGPDAGADARALAAHLNAGGE